MSCEHKHHDHPPVETATGLAALLVLLAVPLGLLVCQQCGVHFCPDELAATLDLWRVTARKFAEPVPRPPLKPADCKSTVL